MMAGVFRRWLIGVKIYGAGKVFLERNTSSHPNWRLPLWIKLSGARDLMRASRSVPRNARALNPSGCLTYLGCVMSLRDANPVNASRCYQI